MAKRIISSAIVVMNGDNNFSYIDTVDGLEKFCRGLRDSKWLAMDTEFLREKTYYPRLCLVQIATDEEVAIIDPLVIDDLSPLLEVLYNHNIIKVMHAARQDLELFFHMRNELPAPVFDTQLAALMLGYPEQVGYSTLVEKALGIQLEKAHTRTDWTLRPLSGGQLRYAADDVIYLAQIYPRFLDSLQTSGRLEWLAEEFGNLCKPETYSNPPALAWMRIRSANRLRSSQLKVLQSLAAWREETAQLEDRPRGWLIKDDALVQIAKLMPETTEKLAQVRDLNERILKKYGELIVELVQLAKQQADVAAIDNTKSERLVPAQEALVDIMMAMVRVCGTEKNITPAALASRKDLERLLLGDNQVEVMQGWRKKMIGDELQALLNGELTIQVCDGELKTVR